MQNPQVKNPKYLKHGNLRTNNIDITHYKIKMKNNELK